METNGDGIEAICPRSLGRDSGAEFPLALLQSTGKSPKHPIPIPRPCLSQHTLLPLMAQLQSIETLP